jgi:hypothetical protein
MSVLSYQLPATGLTPSVCFTPESRRETRRLDASDPDDLLGAVHYRPTYKSLI